MLIGLTMLLFVLNMVRRKQIREPCSLLRNLTAVVITFAAVFIRAVARLSHLVGICYSPTFLSLLPILPLFILQFHVSTVVSSLHEQNRCLTQDPGLLANQVRELRLALRDLSPPSGTDS